MLICQLLGSASFLLHKCRLRSSPEKSGSENMRQLNAFLFNLNHGLRHPFGIYGISLGKCAGRFANVIKALDPFLSVVNSRQVRAEWFDPLLDAEERLLYSLEEHFDDCFSVLDCFLQRRICASQMVT